MRLRWCTHRVNRLDIHFVEFISQSLRFHHILMSVHGIIQVVMSQMHQHFISINRNLVRMVSMRIVRLVHVHQCLHIHSDFLHSQ